MLHIAAALQLANVCLFRETKRNFERCAEKAAASKCTCGVVANDNMDNMAFHESGPHPQGSGKAGDAKSATPNIRAGCTRRHFPM